MTDKERIDDLLKRVIEFAIREMDQSTDGSTGGYNSDRTCTMMMEIEQLYEAGKLEEAFQVYLAWSK